MSDKCTEDVRDEGRWPSFHTCGRKAVATDERGNPRCHIHSPEAVAARQRKSSERYERQMAEALAPYKRVEAAERQRDALADLLRRLVDEVDGMHERFGGTNTGLALSAEARDLLATIEGEQ